MFGKFLLFKIDAVMFCLFVCPTYIPNISELNEILSFSFSFYIVSKNKEERQDLSVNLCTFLFLDIVCVWHSILGKYFTYIYLSYEPTLGGQKNSEPWLLNSNTNSLNSWDFNLKDIHLLSNKSRVAWPEHI